MVFEHIDKLKAEYTDKYVMVDDRYPELQRFRGQVGAVKTVNMSGRALVQFDMDNNIGWYDIDLAFLKVVDAPPPPKDEATGRKKTPADQPGFKATPAKGKPAPEALEKPIGEVTPKAKPAEAQAAPAAAAPGKLSTADILAAARGKAAAPAAKPAAPAAPAGESAKKTSVEDILAAARREKAPGASAAAPAAPAAPQATQEAPSAKPAAPPAKPDPKQMSVADILAAARGEKQSSAATPAPAAETAPAAAPAPAAESEPEPAAEAPPAKPQPASEPAAANETSAAPKRVKLDSVEEMLAYCRRVDAK